MKRDTRTKKQQGFTLIELVVVIAILAILAAFALPRFAQLSEQAHQSSIRATAGALAGGVALAKTQWVSNGFTSAETNVVGFGNDNVDVSDAGRPPLPQTIPVPRWTPPNVKRFGLVFCNPMPPL